MSAIRTAESRWNGTIKEGNGTMKVGSGAFEGKFSFATRFGEEPGTNPDELIAAAHSGCFSMFLSAVLTKAGYSPKSIVTRARVHLGEVDGAPTITRIELNCEADIPEIDEATFLEQADLSKKQCPVSKALAGTEIQLEARLL